ncbi:methyl-accepting chemotaxis protein [Rhodoferax sp. BLA1]|uniref:methyl-accepting chemotaxis protein n=1 Tax=Rhodoferax sp. BLA1 TaxID=2576062 RepID=UPI0015D1B877|nr:methyl-accepting chemotaxis protein [Rhodoferax sp. BLA1]
MHFFHHLRLSQKLYGLVSFFLLALVLASALGIVQMKQLSDEQRLMYTETVVPLRKVVDAGRQAAVHFRRMYPYILKTDPKSREETTGLNGSSEKDVLGAIEFLRKEAPTDELHALGDKLADKWAQYKGSVQKLYAAADAGNADGAMEELKAATDPLHVEVRNLLIEAGKKQESYSKDATERVAAAVDRTANIIMGIMALAIVMGIGFGVAVIRSVQKQLGGDPADAVDAVARVSGGDLATRVEVSAADQSSLMAQLEKMRLGLSDTFKSVRHSAQTVSQATHEISSGTNDLSARTERQAAALEETSSSMEQLGSSASQNADSAQTAHQLAGKASAVASQAGDMVAQVIQTMKGINDSSDKIANIIGVIDSIAFQTNILALNAAVEAARAGEQGRGFAVVASEVRSLAHRSAEAAKEIKGLIDTSTHNVAEGATVVNKTGATMGELVDAIRRVSDLIGEISSASSEQSLGVQQVGQAVAQMDEATQQNAALVEESAASVESLKEQAQQLVHAISVFRLGDDNSRSYAAPRLS